MDTRERDSMSRIHVKTTHCFLPEPVDCTNPRKGAAKRSPERRQSTTMRKLELAPRGSRLRSRVADRARRWHRSEAAPQYEGQGIRQGGRQWPDSYL